MLRDNKKKYPEQQNTTAGTTVLGYKLYYRTIIIKTAWYWHENAHTNQWDITEDAAVCICSHNHPIFDKDAKNTEKSWHLPQMVLER